VKALLDKDPIELAISNEVFTLLKRSNIGRFSLLTSLLTRLGLNCDKPVAPPLSPICLLTTSEVCVNELVRIASWKLSHDKYTPRVKAVDPGSLICCLLQIS